MEENFFYKDQREVSIVSNENNKIRSYSEFFSNPRFLQAITSAAFAYAVMSFLMTATPISMHIVHKSEVKCTKYSKEYMCYWERETLF